MFHNFDYEGWSDLVKIFGNRGAAERFIEEQERISADLREKLAKSGEAHMARVDKIEIVEMDLE
jgi:hypothetical protein